LIGTGLVVIALVVAAFTIPRREPTPGRRAPAPWLVGAMATVAWGAHQTVPSTWLGVFAAFVLLSGLAVGVAWWSGSPAWGQRHVLALCAAVLVVQAIMAFLIEPLGSPDPLVRYAVNAVLGAGVVVILVAAFRRSQRAPIVSAA
jgi:hypothetical protein